MLARLGFLGTASLLLVFAPGLTFAATAQSTAAEVRAADEAWAKHVADVGPAKGVPDGMDAADGLFFDAGPPTRGRTAIAALAAKNYPAGSKLAWTPVNAFGSKSGDMGVTTGDWTFTAPGIKPITGRYVTTWRKTSAGEWKALTDIGAPDAN